jgi:hypothetical protein
VARGALGLARVGFGSVVDLGHVEELRHTVGVPGSGCSRSRSGERVRSDDSDGDRRNGAGDAAI